MHATEAPQAGAARWILGSAALAGVLTVLVAVVAVVATGSDGDDGDAGRAVPSTDGVMTIDLELGDMFVRPSSVVVPTGTELVARVTNMGLVPHDLKVGATGTAMLDPGASQEVSLGRMDGSTQAVCTVPGHKEAGMVFDIDVGAG